MVKSTSTIMMLVATFILNLTNRSVATQVAGELPLGIEKTEMVEELNQLLHSETLGCSAAVADTYEWRIAGYGSNINFLLLAWANAILEGRDDVAIVVNTEELFPRTRCVVASNGQETRSGWPCIFAPMPHLCAFDTNQEWVDFNTLHAMSPMEQQEASSRGGVDFLRGRIPFIEQWLTSSSVDTLGLLAMLYEHLTSHLQPWFKADVEAILAEPDIAAVRAGTYVSMHIRRTDKQIYDGGPFTETEEYFRRAIDYLKTSPNGLGVSDITGVWLSTDDDHVFEEVKALTSKYFPSVAPDAVVFVTNRVPVRLLRPGTWVEGAVDRNTYEAMVLLRAELLMLAGAEVFSGTFSSNIGRIVALMRDTLNKPRGSALSNDTEEWFAG
eukprot:g7396.t1